MMNCIKQHTTIGDLIKDKDYDYISYRLTVDDKSKSFFAGCFRSENGKIISLDGDVYNLDEEVLRYEEWDEPEEGINKGLTVVVDYDWELVIRKTKERIKNKC